MKSVTISRQSAASSRPGNYRLDLTITSGNDITTYLFVKERIMLGDGTIDDTFITVANPSQIEDYAQSNPAVGDTFFRDSSISLVASDPGYLLEMCNTIIADIQLCLIQATDLEVLTVPETIVITPTSVTVS